MCRYNSNGEGILRCLPPLNLGEGCHNHGACGMRWKCSKNILTGRKCFNPHTSLKQGDHCNPNATPAEKQCVESSVPLPHGYEMKCLKNKDGKFMCHRIVGLGKTCKVEKGKPDACENGFSCVRHGNVHVCVDK